MSLSGSLLCTLISNKAFPHQFWPPPTPGPLAPGHSLLPSPEGSGPHPRTDKASSALAPWGDAGIAQLPSGGCPSRTMDFLLCPLLPGFPWPVLSSPGFLRYSSPDFQEAQPTAWPIMCSLVLCLVPNAMAFCMVTQRLIWPRVSMVIPRKT